MRRSTSVLIVLAKIKKLHILKQLFSVVYIPTTVFQELVQNNDKTGVSEIQLSVDDWIFIKEPQNLISFKKLNAGESAAISLASELNADFLLIDERKGRKVAIEHNLKPIGTLGILDIAAKAGHIDLTFTFEQLKQTDFYFSEKMLDAILKSFKANQNKP